MAIRIELSCGMCGHSAGEVIVAGPQRPTPAQLRRAYQEQRPGAGPVWVGDQARCSRCHGQLFLEGLEPARLRAAS